METVPLRKSTVQRGTNEGRMTMNRPNDNDGEKEEPGSDKGEGGTTDKGLVPEERDDSDDNEVCAAAEAQAEMEAREQYAREQWRRRQVHDLQRKLGEAAVKWAKTSTVVNAMTKKAAEEDEIERSALKSILFIPPQEDGTLRTRMDALSMGIAKMDVETWVDTFITPDFFLEHMLSSRDEMYWRLPHTVRARHNAFMRLWACKRERPTLLALSSNSLGIDDLQISPSGHYSGAAGTLSAFPDSNDALQREMVRLREEITLMQPKARRNAVVSLLRIVQSEAESNVKPMPEPFNTLKQGSRSPKASEYRRAPVYQWLVYWAIFYRRKMLDRESCRLREIDRSQQMCIRDLFPAKEEYIRDIYAAKFVQQNSLLGDGASRYDFQFRWKIEISHGRFTCVMGVVDTAVAPENMKIVADTSPSDSVPLMVSCVYMFSTSERKLRCLGVHTQEWTRSNGWRGISEHKYLPDDGSLHRRVGGGDGDGASVGRKRRVAHPTMSSARPALMLAPESGIKRARKSNEDATVTPMTTPTLTRVRDVDWVGAPMKRAKTSSSMLHARRALNFGKQ